MQYDAMPVDINLMLNQYTPKGPFLLPKNPHKFHILYQLFEPPETCRSQKVVGFRLAESTAASCNMQLDLLLMHYSAKSHTKGYGKRDKAMLWSVSLATAPTQDLSATHAKVHMCSILHLD